MGNSQLFDWYRFAEMLVAVRTESVNSRVWIPLLLKVVTDPAIVTKWDPQNTGLRPELLPASLSRQGALFPRFLRPLAYAAAMSGASGMSAILESLEVQGLALEDNSPLPRSTEELLDRAGRLSPGALTWDHSEDLWFALTHQALSSLALAQSNAGDAMVYAFLGSDSDGDPEFGAEQSSARAARYSLSSSRSARATRSGAAIRGSGGGSGGGISVGHYGGNGAIRRPVGGRKNKTANFAQAGGGGGGVYPPIPRTCDQ